jgi:hypothetical protein
MNYAIEMCSGALTHIPSFIKIGSAIQKLIGGGDTPFIFFKIRKVG